MSDLVRFRICILSSTLHMLYVESLMALNLSKITSWQILISKVQKHESHQQLSSLSDPPLTERVQSHGQCLLSRRPSNHPAVSLSQFTSSDL